MKEKKHIDRLFQESFKDFEVTPNDKVWQNIDAKLNDNKKKRRVITIWWRYGGVKAILLILFIRVNIYFNSDFLFIGSCSRWARNAGWLWR